MMWSWLQLLTMLAFPYLSYRLQALPRWPEWLSPVVLCYGLGIALSNLHLLPVDKPLALRVSEVSILLAIPLLLFSTDLMQVRRQAGPVLLSFLLCVLSGLAVNTLAAFLFQGQVADSWAISGMLTGIYTGGTPNMQAIGLALRIDESIIILVNAADVVLGSICLLFLISVGWRLFGLFLRPYLLSGAEAATAEAVVAPKKQVSMSHRLAGIALALLATGLALAGCWLLTGRLEQIALIILGLTTFSLLFSLSGAVRRLPGTYAGGEYFLLIFCVALGLLADFQAIIAEGKELLQFTAFALLGTMILHAALAYVFKIDRDTFLFTLTTAIYGPAFIGQIAAVTRNRQLVFAGISMGLLGYAIGNYLGIGLAYLLRWLLHA